MTCGLAWLLVPRLLIERLLFNRPARGVCYNRSLEK
jgi:hypothetical protein